MRVTRSISIGLALVAAVGIASCGGGGSPTSTNTTAIAKATTASGDGQTAQVATALPLPLRVTVTVNGSPQAGQTVTWAATGTGASVSPTQATTDGSGVATTVWTLGSAAGTQTATASLSGATGSPVTFTATATALPVPLIAMTATASGNAQTDSVAATLPNPLRVLVTLNGTAQTGDTVTWAAAGTGSAMNPVKAVTDASGIATTSWKLGQTAGAQTATATLAGATGSPVNFTATATAGAATQISMVSGSAQTTLVSSAFALPLVVKVGDQFDNGVQGDTVTFASVRGLVTPAPTKAATGATGQAQASLTAGAATGTDTVTATATGLAGSPIRFTATITRAPLTDSVQVGSGISYTSLRNGTSNPAVDTIAAGGTVTWVWAGGTHGVGSTGSPSFTGQTTAQSSGTFAVTFANPGTYTYDCIVHLTAMTGRIVVK
jgi:adhesin/invasin